MKTPTVLAAWAALLLTSSLASAQGQPNASTSRHVGLDVLSIVTDSGGDATMPGGVTLTVHAPPGTVYDLIAEFTGAFEDLAFTDPALSGPLSVTPGNGAPGAPLSFYFTSSFGTVLSGLPASAATVPMVSYFTPLAGAPGIIPSNATSQTLVSRFQLPAGITVALQALLFHPSGIQAPGPNSGTTPFSSTNGQKRITVAAQVTPSISGYTPGPGFTGVGTVRDIEQGDLDGDGDLDELIIGAPINGWTASMISYPGGIPMRNAAPLVGLGDPLFIPTSGEIADLNNDGFMDIIVVSNGGAQVNPAASLQVVLNGGLPGGLAAPLNSTINFDPFYSQIPMRPTDVETADFNGDGLLDIYIACEGIDCAIAVPNRLFFGSYSITGYALNEVTANFVNNPLDSSDDCEVFDFEGDGDMDIVVANYGGNNATGGFAANLIHINDGTGIFFTMVAPGPAVSTADVLAVDLNLNGFDDIYFGNFMAIDPGDCSAGAILPDQLLMNTGGVLVDQSILIPANNWASLDVEAVSIPKDQINFTMGGSNSLSTRDFDGDGDVDIFIGLGSFGNPGIPVAGTNRGVIVLLNQMVQSSTPVGGPLPPFLLNPAIGAADIVDIELGDWLNPLVQARRWFEKDVGIATFAAGTSVLSKNQ